MENTQIKSSIYITYILLLISPIYSQECIVDVGFIDPFTLHNFQTPNCVTFFSLGIVSHISRESKAVAISGLADIKSEKMVGLQASIIFNYAKEGVGYQISMGGAYSDNFKGLQQGLLLNLAKKIKGIQLSLLINGSENVTGAQIGGFNKLTNKITGIQFSLVGNEAKYVNGAQISILQNKADIVKGIQISGLMNIANESDYPIGLLNLVNNGTRGFAFYINEKGDKISLIKSGGKNTYGIIGWAEGQYNSKTKRAIELGYGYIYRPYKQIKLHNELTFFSHFATSKDRYWRLNFKLLPTIEFLKHIRIFLGPSLNIEFCDKHEKVLGPVLFKGKSDPFEIGKPRLYIGYQIGAELFL